MHWQTAHLRQGGRSRKILKTATNCPAVVKIPLKFLYPDRGPDQHRNRTAVRHPAAEKFHENSSITFLQLSAKLVQLPRIVVYSNGKFPFKTFPHLHRGPDQQHNLILLLLYSDIQHTH